jgi:hypothetical protein
VTRSSTPDPDRVLADQTTRLRTLVDDLVKLAPAATWTANLDMRSVCGTPTGQPWPAQWSYALTTTTPTRVPATTLTDRLRTQGWTITERPGGGTAIDRTLAQKDGFVLTIESGPQTGVVGVIGDSPCVTADGTIDRRPVA